MRLVKWAFVFSFCMAGCGSEGVAGDPCESEADCGDGLHCHIEDGAGVCDDEDDDEEHGDDEVEM